MRLAVCGFLMALDWTSAAQAELRHTIGEVALIVNGGVSVVGARVDEAGIAGGFRSEGDIDAHGSLNLEWTSATGLILGVAAAGDTADNRPDTLKNDRVYAYASSEWGRAEVGLTSGPARRMSFAAPVIGAGQIRGDFARYANASALLWPLDTRQSFKLVYLSPPISGLRFGASWSPRVERFATVQKNAFEFGAQFERPVGDWVFGTSAAYVHGSAETPGLRDINSWSIGLQARKGKLVLGGAFVDRGDSNRFGGSLDQRETNIGVAWRDVTWSVAASAARSRSQVADTNVVGLGGSLDVGDHVTLTADLVGLRQRRLTSGWSSGVVLLSGIELHF